jgi:hypothetical protein
MSDRDLDQLMRGERMRSVVAATCYPVVQELLAHLADKNDPDFRSCHAALRRLGLHCHRFNGDHYIEFLADPLDQVLVLLFPGASVDPSIPRQYGELIGNIVQGAVDTNWESHQPVFEEMAVTVREARELFTFAVRGVVERLARNLGFKDGSLSPLLADRERRRVLCGAFDSEGSLEGPAGMVYRQVAEIATGKPPAEIPRAALQRILKLFRTPMRFINQVLKKVICDGMNIERKDSIAFDVRISFLLSGDAIIRGAPVRLVTDDGLIHEAAKAAGVPERVQRYGAYLESLKTGDGIP